MTRASSAAEPSMEEILASIRRIISDGDEGSDREAENTMNPTAPADPRTPKHVAEESESGATPAEDGEPGPGAAETSALAADDEIFELTDEMLAEVPNAAGGAVKPGQGPDTAPAPEAELAMARAEHPPGGMMPVEPKQLDVTFADRTPDNAEAVSRRDSLAASSAVGRAHAHAIPEGEPGLWKDTVVPPGTEPDALKAGNDHLLSPPADAKVAAAFNQLASTILMKDARTLDDLVQDMLRPMLKEWLDDNLPQLVERLVREEIQRVSRGRG